MKLDALQKRPIILIFIAIFPYFLSERILEKNLERQINAISCISSENELTVEQNAVTPSQSLAQSLLIYSIIKESRNDLLRTLYFAVVFHCNRCSNENCFLQQIFQKE